MAWQTDLSTMVRYLINDVTEPYVYANDRVKQAIVIGGLMAAQDYPFSKQYTFDIGNIEITPDPTSSVTYDGVAIALISLKTAAMLSVGMYQKAVRTGIKVRDGDSEVDTTSNFKGYRDILELGSAGAYEKLLWKFSTDKTVGKAVMTPPTIDGINTYGPTFVMSFFDYLRR